MMIFEAVMPLSFNIKVVETEGMQSEYIPRSFIEFSRNIPSNRKITYNGLAGTSRCCCYQIEGSIYSQ